MNFNSFIIRTALGCFFLPCAIFFSSCLERMEFADEFSKFQDREGGVLFNWPIIRFKNVEDREFFRNGWQVFLRYNGESGYYPVDVLSLFARRGEVEVKIDSIEALNKIDVFQINDEKDVLRYLNIFFKDSGLAFYFSTPWVVGTKTGNVRIRREADGFLIEREVFVLEHEHLRAWGEATLYFVREKLSFDGKYKLLESEARLKFNYDLGLKQNRLSHGKNDIIL